MSSRMVATGSRGGHHPGVFEDWQDLKLTEATSFENGVAPLRYKIKN